MKNRRILFFVNTPDFLFSHRMPVALAARDAGFDVHLATGPGENKELNSLDFQHHKIPLSRSGRSIFAELRSLWAIYRLMRRLKPDLVHLVTVKPVLYGGMMAKLAGVPSVVVAISGLGSVFVARPGSISLMRRAVEILYRLALKHPHLKVIFQNPDDQANMMRFGGLGDNQVVLIQGSGVELSDYPVQSDPDGIPVVTFASRLLKDKGVVEFVEAARLLKERGMVARFWLVGASDSGNPSSVGDKEIERWKEAGLIEAFGFRSDIARIFAQSNLVTLPSCYGEGLPKVLIEAAACGRAVITTDMPGCRDAIEPDVTGLLIPARDAGALADAVEQLLKDKQLRQSMGRAGRARAEREFGIEKVIKAHLQIYQELLEACLSR